MYWVNFFKTLPQKVINDAQFLNAQLDQLYLDKINKIQKIK